MLVCLLFVLSCLRVFCRCLLTYSKYLSPRNPAMTITLKTMNMTFFRLLSCAQNMHVRIGMFVSVCMYLCVCICVYVSVCIYVCMHVLIVHPSVLPFVRVSLCPSVCLSVVRSEVKNRERGQARKVDKSSSTITRIYCT